MDDLSKGGEKNRPPKVRAYSEYTDEELLSAELLFHGDPTTQDGISYELPTTWAYRRIANRYFAPDGTHCVFKNHAHKRGFTVEIEGLQGEILHVLVGINCGEDLTGESWGAEAKDFELAVRRKGLLEWRNRLRPVLKDVVGGLHAWVQPAKDAAAHRSGFRHTATQLFPEP